MKNIFKILVVLVLPLLLLSACRNEADRDWTTPEASFKLQETNPGAAVLYPTMANNPYILTWSKVEGASSYSVVVSAKEDFATKSVLGTSDTNTLKTNIATLNTAMLQAGINPYAPQTVYVRVEAGTAVSNTISFTVTPYPVAVPVITSPTAGQTIVLDAANPLATAATVKWTDYSYGVNVNYTVEIAKKGSDKFVATGATVNDKQLIWTNYALNDAALKAGLTIGITSEMDVRVTATTTSTGGTISKVSEMVTFKVLPYQPAFINFHIVGSATAAGWNETKAQLLKNTNEISEIYTYLEQNGEFRFLGQKNWNPDNYSLNAAGIKDEYKYFNTWSTNLEPSGPDNIKFTGNSGMYKITINQNSRSISVTPSAIPTVPANVYLVGSLNGWDAGNALEMMLVGDGVFEYTIIIPDGAEFKFIGQQAWGDLEWADLKSEGDTGYLAPKGSNNNIKFDGGGANYKITANIKLGIYTITPL